MVDLGYDSKLVTERSQSLLLVDTDKCSEMAQKDFIDITKPLIKVIFWLPELSVAVIHINFVRKIFV